MSGRKQGKEERTQNRKKEKTGNDEGRKEEVTETWTERERRKERRMKRRFDDKNINIENRKRQAGIKEGMNIKGYQYFLIIWMINVCVTCFCSAIHRIILSSVE